MFRLLSTKLQPPGGTIVTAPRGAAPKYHRIGRTTVQKRSKTRSFVPGVWLLLQGHVCEMSRICTRCLLGGRQQTNFIKFVFN